ncbi:DUF3967 domain-containing protein [Sporosarcina limicola]|uniref:Transcriptional regulator n=1 Tax=Sporosarcina limicola TaxID=34101 RepID=A0A927MK84_9BACL|nr:DUF3967 domain-containing protein [Sporosarcina limicola]MBE1555411.1 putative transcriptional regulator [Sporosarcina limicola]
MENDTKTCSSKHVAKRLSIQPVNVRKYSQMLEKQGYSFIKDEKGWGQYSEVDIGFLEYLRDMKKMGKPLDELANHIAVLYRANLSIAQPAIPLQDKDVLLEFIKTQHEFNQKVLEQLETHEKRQIQKDQNLLIAIRETQEVKKQIAATQQKRWCMF